MCRRLLFTEQYPFAWLDYLAEFALNPEKNNVKVLKEAELTAVKQRLPEEFNRISSTLKRQAFCLYSSEQIKVIAGHYDQALRMLMRQTEINLAQYTETGPLRETTQQLLNHLTDFYQAIQLRYKIDSSEPPRGDSESQALYKVVCRLSVDQIAIILKAADDIKLVVTRSFSQVLKSIVPFLSTERLKNFSWKSARSSTYKMEYNDKEVVIQALTALIDKVKEY